MRPSRKRRRPVFSQHGSYSTFEPHLKLKSFKQEGKVFRSAQLHSNRAGFEFSTRTLAKCELYFKNASREDQHLNFSASRIFGPFFVCKMKVECRNVLRN